MTKLQWVSNDGSVLGKCEGDCDSDGHCEGDLVCGYRSAYESDPIPGCIGDLLAIDDIHDDLGSDYCHELTSAPTTEPTMEPTTTAPTTAVPTTEGTFTW